MRIRLASVAVLGLLGCGVGGTEPVDGSSPFLTIVAPLPEAVVRGQVNIDVEAFDDFGVDKVRFLIDNVELTTLFTPPFRVTWNTIPLADNSSHTIRVEASDVAKNISIQQITVTVSNGTQ